jgi:hypothetical protein
MSRVQSPIYEEGEFERRVEFDTSRNIGMESGYRSTSPPGPWSKRENLRKDPRKDKKEAQKEKKEKKETKERGKDMGKEKGTHREFVKEKDLRGDSGRETRKGQSHPTSALRGYKYPLPQQPRPILKRTESSTPQGKSTAIGSVEFIKQARHPMDRPKGMSSASIVLNSSYFSRRNLESNMERTKYPSQKYHLK